VEAQTRLLATLGFALIKTTATIPTLISTHSTSTSISLATTSPPDPSPTPSQSSQKGSSLSASDIAGTVSIVLALALAGILVSVLLKYKKKNLKGHFGSFLEYLLMRLQKPTRRHGRRNPNSNREEYELDIIS
jgi:hypothetical protein